jgi:outer membrane lipase/esterase
MKKKFLRSLIGFSLFIFSFSAIADIPSQQQFAFNSSNEQLFDNIFYFGDSLTDIGNSPIANGNGTPANPGLINPGGLRWPQYLSAQFGLLVAPSNQGGNDFAYAGAQTSATPGFPVTAATPHSVQAQITELLNRGVPLDQKALYAIWVGSNNINDELQFDVLRFVLAFFFANFKLPTSAEIANFIQTTAAPRIINQGVGDLVTIAQRLYAAGARFIMIANLPDLGLTPIGRSTPVAPALSQISTAFNQTLESRLGALNFDIIQLDVQSLFTYIIQHPQQFGFIDSTSQAIQHPNMNPNLFLFWDVEHPTSAGQKIVSDYAYSVLTGPLTAAVLAEVPFTVMAGLQFSVENQIYATRTGMMCIPVNCNAPFVNANYIPTKIDRNQTSNPEVKSNATNFTAGLLHRFNQNLILGFALGRSDGSISYSLEEQSIPGIENYTINGGKFNINENMAALIGNYQCNKAYVDAIVSGGLINFNNIRRFFPLGIVTNVTEANTHGQQLGGDLVGGYNIANCRLKTGPIANIDYQTLTVNAFAENNGLPGTNLQYRIQDNQSLISGIGWQGSYAFCFCNVGLMPFLQITFDREWFDDQRNIKAGVVSLPASHYHIPYPGMNGDFGLVNSGLMINPNRYISISLNYQSTFSHGGVRVQNSLIGLQLLI